jgi:hypothetical protein
VSPDFARVLMQINRRAIGQSSKEEQGESVTHTPLHRQNGACTLIWSKGTAKTRRVLSSKWTHLVQDAYDEFYYEGRFDNVISNILCGEV